MTGRASKHRAGPMVCQTAGMRDSQTSIDQAQKAERFRALHLQPGAFVIPNPWDAGTARMLTSLGFQALTTTSGGLAVSLGRRDGEAAVTRDETLANVRSIVEATHLPVAADLENGFGHEPEVVAETIRLTAEAGAVGGSIEDATGDPRRPIYDFQHAVERVAAAAEAARALTFPFILVGRAENPRFGVGDLDDTIRRLQAFARAGADVLFAPGLTRAEDIRTVCASVDKPVNVVMSFKQTEGPPLTTEALAALGVKRISLGAALCRAALGAFLRAARDVKDQGTFGFVAQAVPLNELNELLTPAPPADPRIRS
jgi:2-methylisocitrate lyase-like PEP mutase family enzyme